tara:strand:+ start:318 stop:650 length:333 start_codon:yes stop_codon:yes gene_type:complete
MTIAASQDALAACAAQLAPAGVTCAQAPAGQFCKWIADPRGRYKIPVPLACLQVAAGLHPGKAATPEDLASVVADARALQGEPPPTEPKTPPAVWIIGAATVAAVAILWA